MKRHPSFLTKLPVIMFVSLVRCHERCKGRPTMFLCIRANRLALVSEMFGKKWRYYPKHWRIMSQCGMVWNGVTGLAFEMERDTTNIGVMMLHELQEATGSRCTRPWWTDQIGVVAMYSFSKYVENGNVASLYTMPLECLLGCSWQVDAVLLVMPSWRKAPITKSLESW